MKSTTNVFQEGLITDRHPLSTPQNCLTDALNATLLTYNGNEMMLQNDTGNTRIQDSATGNIMSLSPGFIPVGMKEHGGIMYIASVNKEGEGEIGTIPSPIIRDIYKAKISIPFYDTIIPVDTGDPIQITNKLYPADKFIANLQMTIDPNNLKGILHTKKSGLSVQDKDPCDIVLERQICNTITSDGRIYSNSLYSPVISYSTNSEDNVYIDELEYPRFIRKKGIYKLNLYSSPEEGKSVIASDNLLSSQVYGPDGENKSQYWFLHTDYPTTVFPKDLFNATLNKDLKQVPVSNKPGKLAIELIPESITDFGMLPREDELHVPITYKTKDVEYHTYFPGFYYTSDNGLYVEKLTARVIDESTNLEVDLVYPYDKEVLFDRFDLSGITYESSQDDNYDNPFCNGGLKLWNLHGRFGLPHQRSNQSSNTQILSPIAGLFNHKQTSFKSSTQDKDDSPHSGVFYANLGDKYQNWYRLEVNYEDQYGGNKGTFTTRFNPYINDVFGTNLSVDGIELIKSISMEPGTVVYEKKYSGSCTFESVYKFPNIYIQGNDQRLNDNYPTLQIGSNYLTDSKSRDDGDSIVEISTIDQIPNTDNGVAIELCDKYLYFSSNYTLEDRLHTTSDFKKIWTPARMGPISFDGLTVLDGKWYITSNKPIGEAYYKSLISDVYTVGANLETTDSVLILKPNVNSSFVSGNVVNLPYFSDNRLNEGTNQDVSIYEDFVYTSNCSLQGNQLIFTRSPKIEFKVKQFFYSFGNGVYTAPDIKYQYYFKPKSNIEEQPAVISILPQLWLQHTIQYDVDKIVKFNSFYYITPYFLLQGIKDDGEKAYTQRFGKLQGERAVYEHNFESDSKGLTINYISDPNSYIYADSTPCSYNEQTPFKYLQDDISLAGDSTSLESGIYVLNIQRCPGVGNWTQSKDVPLINLQINIGDASYNVKNWSTDVLDTNGFKYKTPDGTDTSNMRIYTPIVLVIPYGSSFGIKIESSNAKYNFTRQSLGLYKIREVEQDEIVNNLGFTESEVYLYQDYMKLIQDRSAQLDTVKQYAFMQKYGIFFKEAFVFVDGLYKNNQVNHITIGTKTYRPYPYIPSDPSILPVNLGEDGNYYWNTYYMPEEVLTSDDCEFIFSNASDLPHIIDAEFKSVQSGKLRQLIN